MLLSVIRGEPGRERSTPKAETTKVPKSQTEILHYMKFYFH